MIELINDDYADFVHLSSRLVGLEDSVGKIEKDLKVRGLSKLLVVVCLRDENGISYSLEVTQFELMISWPILPRLIFSSNKFCIFLVELERIRGHDEGLDWSCGGDRGEVSATHFKQTCTGKPVSILF